MKRISCIVLALLLFLLAACTPGQEKPEGSTEPTANATAEPTETAPYVGDFSYDPATDFDQKLGMNGNWSTVIETDDVYYWLQNDDSYLRYCEKDGSDYGVVCGKPECEHDGGNPIRYHVEKNCNGYLGAPSSNYFWLMDGKLYYVDGSMWKTYRDSCGVIMRMDLDGTNRELVKVLPKVNTVHGELHPQCFCYHRGMIYSFAFGGTIDSGEPSQPFVAVALPLDGEEWTTIYDSGEDFHYGSIMPVGDYCYITDTAWAYADPSILEDDDYDGEIVASRNEDIILRWCSVTGELETLYRGVELGGVFRYWIDGEGNFYVPEKYEEGVGSKRLLRLNDGKWEEVLSFDDPDVGYTIRSISDGIVIARNYEAYDRESYIKNGDSTDIDIWIKRFDGTTVYKGKLPMSWLEAVPETPTFEGLQLFCGNENELLCIFETCKRTPSRSNEPQSFVLVKYLLTEGGIEEVLLGKTYHAIINDWD